LVQEGRALAPQIYHLMTLLNGTRDIRDLQMELMRQGGGVLVGTDEVKGLLRQLDESFLLDSEGFRQARDQVVASFNSARLRPCSHCGVAYPKDPLELRNSLDEILNSQPPLEGPAGKIEALISPHIDLKVGHRVYASAYRTLRFAAPTRVVILGVGHRMAEDLFCLTDKEFETPLGVIKGEKGLIRTLREAGGDIIAAHDFPHRSEHSIEFQLIFLQHLLKEASFEIIPILCGFMQTCLPEYTRQAYLEKAGPFLDAMREIIRDPERETLLVAGVDFSHTGPKFGHEMPADYMESQSQAHDKNLLKDLAELDPEHFWEESKGVGDRFNVCGFSALACLLEVLPPCKGQVLDYQIWHEAPTRSAVSFAAVAFTKE
jgi:AmmeMemoRadiSam system protein B